MLLLFALEQGSLNQGGLDGDGYFSESSFGLGIFKEPDHQNRGPRFVNEEEEDEESFIPHSQKRYLQHHQEHHINRHSPVKPKRRPKDKKQSGRHKQRGNVRGVLQPLPVPPLQTGKGNKTEDNNMVVTTRRAGNDTATQIEALEKQLMNLKGKEKRSAEGENGDESSNKKVKPSQHKPHAVKYDSDEASKFKNAMKKWVCPEVKFLSNEEEAKKCMKIAVMMTNHYTDYGLDKLSEDELDLQIQEYYDKYGGPCVRKFINTQRNQLGQALRKVVLRLHKEGRAFTPGQLMSVVTRNPDRLLLKPSHFDEGDPEEIKEQARANKEVNDANKKHRKRFLTYIDEMIPATTPQGVWGEQQRNQHMLFCCQHRVAGELKDVVPVDEEAMIVVMFENNWAKWAWQALVWKEHGMNMRQYEEHVGYDEFQEQQPDALYSDAEGGNSKFGGWKEEGVLRFAEVRDKITEARRNRDCRKVEKQFQNLLLRKYPANTKKDKAKDKKAPPSQSRTSVAFGAGAARKKKGVPKAALHDEAYDSEEEAKKMEVFLNFETKVGKQEGKKAKKKKGTKGKAKINQVDATGDGGGVSAAVADAIESSEEEDDDLIRRSMASPKENEVGGGVNE